MEGTRKHPSPNARKMLTTLCILLVANLPLYPQASGVADQEFKIAILQGDGATHFVNYSRPEIPAVRVTAGGRPLNGVQVTFQLPDSGPSGSFQGENGRRTLILARDTDKNGRAEAKSFSPNQELGAYTLSVTAVQGNRSASVEVRQTNAFSPSAAKQRKASKVVWITVAAVVGVAVVAIVLVVTGHVKGPSL
jgi:hypothetical protein